MTSFAWSRDLLSGSLVASITLAYGFSFAALLFPGPLAPGAGTGVAMTLFGAGLAGLWISWRSRLPLAVAGPDTPVMTAICALVAAIVLPLLEAGALSVEAGVAMAASIILVTTAIVGLCLLALGLGRVGSVLRFIPHPVVGGFLAGSGVALCQGALRLLLQAPPSEASLLAMTGPDRLPQLLAALLIPVLLLALRPFWRPFYLLPLLFFLELGAIHLAIALGAIDSAAPGWFLPGGAASSGGVQPLWQLAPGAETWSAILAHLPEIAAVALIAATSVLMNVSGLEVMWRRSVSLDRELVDHGIAGVLGGLAGGASSSLSLSRSLLNREAGGRGRLAGLFAAAVALGCSLFGGGLVALLPLPLLGGLLLFVGLSMLLDRLAELPPRQSLSDYLLMLVILGLIAGYGFLEGVLAGIVGACLLFAFSYSRIGIVRHVLNRRERASDVERPLPQKQLLEQHGELIRVVGLRGYIFFGTSNGLLDLIRATYDKRPAAGPQLLILDFQAVTGIDSSALVSFLKLAHFCEERAVELLFSAIPPAVDRVLCSQLQSPLTGIRRFASQEEALEHAEEIVLTWGGAGDGGVLPPESWFRRDGGGQESIARLLALLESRTVEAGGVIFRQGEPSDTIELLVSGRVQVQLELPNGVRVRLRSMLEQTVLGEMGFFRNLPRSATVIADQPSRLLRVTRETYQRMLTEDPEAAAVLHRMIISTLADRLAFANSEIAALKR